MVLCSSSFNEGVARERGSVISKWCYGAQLSCSEHCRHWIMFWLAKAKWGVSTEQMLASP